MSIDDGNDVLCGVGGGPCADYDCTAQVVRKFDKEIVGAVLVVQLYASTILL